MISHDKCASFEAEINNLLKKIDDLTTLIASYEATIGHLKDCLQEIANEDYRGNRSNASVKAFQALQKIKSTK